MDARTKADEALVRSVIEQWARATGERKTDAVLALQVAQPLTYALPPPLVQAGDEREGLESWFATWDGTFRHEPRDLDVHVDGSVAFATCLMHLVGTKTDGAKNDVWFRQTLGLRRQDDAWRIVHVHQSVPFRMDGSEKAELGLKP